ASCSALNNLNLSGTSVTGKGFGVLSGKDMTLILDESDVSDETLPDVLQIPGLTKISLQDTKITGASFPQGTSTGLAFVVLSGAPLTARGIEALEKAN